MLLQTVQQKSRPAINIVRYMSHMLKCALLGLTILLAGSCRQTCPCGICLTWHLADDEQASNTVATGDNASGAGAFHCAGEQANLPVTGDLFRGLSGLAAVPPSGEQVQASSGLELAQGDFLAIPEDGGHLLWMQKEATSDDHNHATIYSIALPDTGDLELESIAVSADRHTVYIGTERESLRASDWILAGTIRETGAGRASSDLQFIEEQRIALPYDNLWSFENDDDYGIEGLCAIDGHLIAAVEYVFEEQHPGEALRRFAPVGVWNTRNGQWQAYHLRLTSDKGRVSSIACREDSNGNIQLVAIERDFGIMRLLQFSIPAADTQATDEITAKVIYDFVAVQPEFKLNLEGADWYDSNRLMLVSDNQFRANLDTTTFIILPIDQ
ncbi:MAG: esterase-like activity of phytase family protein [Leptospiraceae bacterium]|nr:esterase-like activity of phytase family protein [Leptospiraceae bacterium]